MQRDQQVKRVLVVEGAANVVILLVKVLVGLFTGSLAIMADAMHSLMDVVNNIIAWVVVRASAAPPDAEHPYGHRKFETLAVFFLATLLTVLAIELVLHAFRREAPDIDASPLGLLFMLGVLAINIGLASWQRLWARRLDSSILHADASHTFTDVLTTVGVIIGWQLSARGWPWLDSLCAVFVGGVVLYLAVQLFRRVVPVLVDERSVDTQLLEESVGSVEGVREVRRVRSRWQGDRRSVDLIVAVAPMLATREAHAIADAIEARLEERFSVTDVSVHIEPDETPS
ncbi:MAG: cation diffusion facilitator family transporter [Gammaproteobacteria bacterium]